MKILNDSVPWATLMTAGLVLIAAVAGAGVVIWGEDGALSFQQYLDLLKNFAIAVGVLGIGRGIVSYGKNTAAAKMLTDESLVSSGPIEDAWREDDWPVDEGTVTGGTRPRPVEQPQIIDG
jgi:hypothetical protein